VLQVIAQGGSSGDMCLSLFLQADRQSQRAWARGRPLQVRLRPGLSKA